MKKTFAFLLSLFVLSGSLLHAQDDPKSKAIIDKMISKSRTYTSFEADFSSVLVNTASKLNVKQEGNVKVKGKLFRLSLTDNTVINDGKAIYTYSKKSNEVTISDPADMDKELDPTKIFSIYEQGFKSQFVEEKKEADGTVTQSLKLFPLEPGKKPYHTVFMVVDKAKLEPRMVKVLYKDGNEVTYTLKKFTPNVDLFDSVFTFDKTKFPGVEINDVR
ncbi:MAG: outer membrane lipoprotein carrier protein LolA [Flavobacteriales bacterium]|nr:outer membrane lipoprotein carrier protein LolA [Flavobacteriales bacterium]